MKKISPLKNKASPFSRIMQRGHEKTKYNGRNGKLLMSISEENHQRVAKLVSYWLEQDETNQ